MAIGEALRDKIEDKSLDDISSLSLSVVEKLKHRKLKRKKPRGKDVLLEVQSLASSQRPKDYAEVADFNRQEDYIKTQPSLRINFAETKYPLQPSHEDTQPLEGREQLKSIDEFMYSFLIQPHLDNIRAYMDTHLHDTTLELHGADSFGQQPLGTEEAFLLLKYINQIIQKGMHTFPPEEVAKIFQLLASELGYTNVVSSEEVITNTQTGTLDRIPVIKWKIPSREGKKEIVMAWDFSKLPSQLMEEGFDYEDFIVEMNANNSPDLHAANFHSEGVISPTIPGYLTQRATRFFPENDVPITPTQVIPESQLYSDIIPKAKRASSLIRGLGNAANAVVAEAKNRFITRPFRKITGKLT